MRDEIGSPEEFSGEDEENGIVLVAVVYVMCNLLIFSECFWKNYI